MKNGVEYYKDFFGYFNALKTNCGGLISEVFFHFGHILKNWAKSMFLITKMKRQKRQQSLDRFLNFF